MDFKKAFNTIKEALKGKNKLVLYVFLALAGLFLIVWLSNSYSYNKALKKANKENAYKIDSIQETKLKLVNSLEELNYSLRAKEDELIILEDNYKQLKKELNKLNYESQLIKDSYFDSSISERVNLWTKLTNEGK